MPPLYSVNLSSLRALGIWEQSVTYEPREALTFDTTTQNPHLVTLKALKEFHSTPYMSSITYAAIRGRRHGRTQIVVFYTSPPSEVEASYATFKEASLAKFDHCSRILRATAFRRLCLEYQNAQWKIVKRETEHDNGSREPDTEEGDECHFSRLAMRMDQAVELYYQVYFQQKHTPPYFSRAFVNRKIRHIQRQQGRLLPSCYLERSLQNFTDCYLKHDAAKIGPGPPMSWKERHRLMLGQSCCVMKSSIHGHGLFALVYIPRGKNVIEYVGEIVNKEQANQRERILSSKGFTSTYMFSISSNQEIIVDATFIGNAARFANHSCLPNCEVHVIENRLYLRALENISPGDELCYNYHLRQMEGDIRLQCFCNAPNCRGFMDA
ncbi:SET domain-containing protein [Giardia duodenalis]|uniref:SET domain-containing protein n=1 Tax=Giardia intestinalis (strain ATCC 50803 / WB clone C6) TaxID=184922 RepID=A8BCA8_GIAIC|nr:SET domain-containing protein [Giardia intestinalis]KAE8301410.1 SET domain-containing protein [Giardia intestinalis]|eukprot:XP_001707862.1 Hypothetical protein GL50803_13838 [Giardia lamblia ATCC 50803]